MSGVYEAYLEASERWYQESDHLTCSDHILDEYVQGRIREAADPNASCTYCDGNPAAPVTLVQKLLLGAVRSAFVDASGEPVWDSEDKEYHISPYTVGEAVEGYVDSLTDFDPLTDELYSCLQDDKDLLPADWNYTSYGEALETAWHRFADLIRHRQRYAFWLPELDDGSKYGDGSSDYIQPSKVLHEVALLIDGDRSRLLREIDVDAEIWRCRTHPSTPPGNWDTAPELGTIPTKYAKQPNRMSAPGIPLFYGSLEAETAFAEVARRHDPSHDLVAEGAFTASRPLLVVDLTNLEPLPSLFDPDVDSGPTRNPRFLQRFVADLSAPVDPAAELVDYVPTQVVTEFMIHALERVLPDVDCIDGIMYPSAARVGGSSLVLDVGNAECVSALSPPLKWRWSKPRLELILKAKSTSLRNLHA